MNKELKEAAAKGKIHYLRDRVPGTHNKLKGMHSKDPATCKACVSVMVAEFEFEGKLYVGVAIRNDHDQIRRKIGRSISMGRAIKNAEFGHSSDRTAFDKLLTASYKGEVKFLKEDWKAFTKVQ